MSTTKQKEEQGAAVTSTTVDDELRAKLEADFPPAWQPSAAGDEVAGAFLRLEQGMTKYGPAPIVILGTADAGEVSVWLFYESMKSGFLRAQPVPGERVAIRYEGEQPVKNPTPGKSPTFHSYRVIVDRPAQQSQPVDWGAALATPTRDEGAAA